MAKQSQKKPGPKKGKPKPERNGPQNHFIPEWLAHRNKIDAELGRGTGADKGTISRWLNKGEIPSKRYIGKVADFLECSVNDLFRKPDEIRLGQEELVLISKYRAQDESGRTRLVTVVQNAFPD